MARCIEDVTRRRPGWGSHTAQCDNPAEFSVRLSEWEERPLRVCRTHLPVLVKRVLMSPKRAKLPVTVGLLIFEDEVKGNA